MIETLISLSGSKIKFYLYVLIFALVLFGAIFIGINHFIESKKTDFKPSEPTKWEDVKTYKDMLIK